MSFFGSPGFGPSMMANDHGRIARDGHGMGGLARLAQRMFPGRFNQQTGGGAQQSQVPQMQTGGGGQMSQLPPPSMTGGPGQVQQAPQPQTGGGLQPNSLAQTFINGGGMQQMGGFNPRPPGLPQPGGFGQLPQMPGVPSGLGSAFGPRPPSTFGSHNPFGGFGFGGSERNTGPFTQYPGGPQQFYSDRTA